MAPGTLHIAVLHAQASQREALCDFIADEVGFRVVGGRGSAAEALDLMRNAATHVLLVDLDSVGAAAQDLLTSARDASPGTGILLIVDGAPACDLDALMARGAGGWLRATEARAELVPALRTIGMGRRYRPPAA